MGTISPASTSATINWTVASQTDIFSNTGGDVAGWGVQPVFQAIAGQFAGKFDDRPRRLGAPGCGGRMIRGLR